MTDTFDPSLSLSLSWMVSTFYIFLNCTASYCNKIARPLTEESLSMSVRLVIALTRSPDNYLVLKVPNESHDPAYHVSRIRVYLCCFPWQQWIAVECGDRIIAETDK